MLAQFQYVNDEDAYTTAILRIRQIHWFRPYAIPTRTVLWLAGVYLYARLFAVPESLTELVSFTIISLIFIAWTLCMILSDRIDLYLLRRKVRRSPQYGELETVTFFDDGIHLDDSNATSVVSWASVEGRHQFPDGLLIQLNSGSHVWLPWKDLVLGQQAKVLETFGARLDRSIDELHNGKSLQFEKSQIIQKPWDSNTADYPLDNILCMIKNDKQTIVRSFIEYRKSNKDMKYLNGVRVLLSVVLLGLYGFLLSLPKAQTFSAFLFLSAIFPGFTILLWSANKLEAYLVYLRLRRRPAFNSEFQVQLSERAIAITSDESSSIVEWELVESAVRARDGYLLRLNCGAGLWLPKDSFVSAHDSQFEGLLKQKSVPLRYRSSEK
jgi:hypothetical protein